jgi:membrane-bound lytic murein transglycosylase A
MKAKIRLLTLLLICVFFIGCQKPSVAPDYNRPLPPGVLALRKITDPQEIPDFTAGCYNMARMPKAIDSSLNYLGKPSSQQFFPYGHITHQHAVDSLKAFKQLIDSGLRGRDLHTAIVEQFDVYISVGCDDMGTVLFTGYYTPIFDASTVATGQFQYPLYKQPDDLVKAADGRTLGQRQSSGQITPYPDRAEIENSKMLTGTELVWLSDPFEVYIAHVQGSAKLRMPDGKLITVGYSATNGHEYRSIAHELINDGRITADQLSLSTMIELFKTQTDLVATYTQRNPRFVFFRTQDGPPRGSINEPVVLMRTIATDKSIYPRACLAFIDTVLPKVVAGQVYRDPFGGFVLDQDTGGAIRAPGRCDVYMGQGDDAGKRAGHTYQEGKLYYLFLKQADEIIF